MSEHALSEQATPPNDAGEHAPAPNAGQPQQQADSAPVNDEEYSRAKNLGWQDKEAYLARGGKEGAWVPYDEFLKVHDRQLPLIRKEAKKLERLVQAKDQELADL